MKVVDEKPRAVREQITVQPMGAEILAYDERRHMAFCLNASAAAVWRLADGTRSAAEIADAASGELEATISEEIVHLALDELRGCGLVEAAETGPSVIVGSPGIDTQESAVPEQSFSTTAISRRAILTRLGAAALLPVVASIVAPTAAQAYSGCVDCSVARPLRHGSSPSIPSSDPDQ